MTSPPNSAGPTLRQIRWPSLSAVDLLSECHWLVTLNDTRTDRGRKSQQSGHKARQKHPEIDTKKLQRDGSPYRQHLRCPKTPAPSPGSPAQRAAKSMLKLKEDLSRFDGSEWVPEESTIVASAQHPHEQQPLSRAEVRSFTKSNGFGPKSPTRVESPGANKAKVSPLRSPSKKEKKRPLTREQQELAKKQARLAEWLNSNPDTSGDSQDTKHSLYSVEVETRIESAIQCSTVLESGVGLWDDPVRSLLAVEMTSEVVFGGAVPTRALAFQLASPARSSAIVDTEMTLPDSPPKPKLNDYPLDTQQLDPAISAGSAQSLDEDELSADITPSTTNLMSDHAQKVFKTAHCHAARGAVSDALATLDAGIHQSLSPMQANMDAVNSSQTKGFNYSELAHSTATKLQLYYRARHRWRMRKLIFLQQRWRDWHTRRQVLSTKQFENKSAVAIQRHYKQWHTHITQERSAIRIQRCLRLYESQKYLIRFRQACRLLLKRKAQRRQVKSRIRVMARLVSSWLKRMRRISLVQSLWRARCARAQLAALLAHAAIVEFERRGREDQFVAMKLDRARTYFREFLTTTQRGRQLVYWQQEKPWLRFRRLRRDSNNWENLLMHERVDAVSRILYGRKFQGLQQRALCQMLVGADNILPALPRALAVSAEALGFLDVAAVSSEKPVPLNTVGCCPWWSQMNQRVKRSCAKLSLRATKMWWTFITWPKEYCVARICPIRRRRRNQARQELEDDCARVLEGFLRVWFRHLDIANVPPYTCEWCSEPFSSCREYFAHDKCATARAQADAEWAELCKDLDFVRRKRWNMFRKHHKDSVRLDLRAFELNVASVRRLRRSYSRRKALKLLVATIEACTGNDVTQNEMIPLDLVAFLLQYLNDSHLLVLTAERQIVQWKTPVKPTESSPRATVEHSSSTGSRWIRKDELRSRLVVGGEWSPLRRWRRSVEASWTRMAKRWRPMISSRNEPDQTLVAAQRSPATSPARSRVLPVAT